MGVLLSTVSVMVPVGVTVPVAGATVIVNVSEAPTLGAVLEAVIVVVVVIAVDPPELAGQAPARL
jgi:hypothetical protein